MGRPDIFRAPAIVVLIARLHRDARRDQSASAPAPAMTPDAQCTSAADDLSAELRRCSALGPAGCRRPALPSGLGGEPPSLLRQAGAAVAATSPQAAAGQPHHRETRDEQCRRHRHLPQYLHHLHRFRLRPARGRGRLPVLDADRHRHHARRPVLGLGRRRGRPRAPGQEDALCRLLRLPDRQLQQPRQDRLQLLRRPWPEGRRLVDLGRPTSCSPAGSPRSASMPASRSSTRQAS